MAGGMENKFDFILCAVKFFGVAEGQAGHAASAAVDVIVGEKRVVGNIFLLLLTEP